LAQARINLDLMAKKGNTRCGVMANRSASAPSLSRQAADDDNVDIGDFIIRKRITKAKDKASQRKDRLEQTMQASRSMWFKSLPAAGTLCMQPASKLNKKSALERALEDEKKQDDGYREPKFVGQGANELAQWKNADDISRRKEETNLALPTLRQVLKVDDRITLKQITGNQLSSLGEDPTDYNKLFNPNAKKRYGFSWRSAK